MAARILLGAAVAVTVMLIALAVGTRLDDASIDGHRAVATATVLTVSPLRTGIEFVNAGGVAVRPPGGVLYPGLLAVGQRFVVEYSTLDPSVVRVAGRTAEVGNVLIAVTMLGTWTVAVPLVWLLRSRARRTRMRPGSRASGTVQAADQLVNPGGGSTGEGGRRISRRTRLPPSPPGRAHPLRLRAPRR